MNDSPKATIISGGNSYEDAAYSSDRFPETADIETASDDYASRFSGPIGEWLLQVQEQATLRMLKPYPEATILDVGGGHAQLTPALIREGYQVTVLGSDESCNRRITPFLEEGSCQFEVGSVLCLPYSDNTFDIVISYRFLAHVTHWETFLSELNRVAKRAIIIDYPTLRSFNSIAPFLFKFKKNIEQNTRPYISYEEKQIIKHLRSLDAEPVERYAQFFWPMVLHRMLNSPRISSILEGLVRLSGATSLLGSPVILKSCKKQVKLH